MDRTLGRRTKPVCGSCVAEVIDFKAGETVAVANLGDVTEGD